MFKSISTKQTFAREGDRLILKNTSLQEADANKRGARVYGAVIGFFGWMIGKVDRVKGFNEMGRAATWFVNRNSYSNWLQKELAHHGLTASQFPKKQLLDGMVEAVKKTTSAPAPLPFSTPLIQFYQGKGKDVSGRTIQDMWDFSLSSKESQHDYIQWLFPSNKPSAYNPTAPIPTPKEIAFMKQDPTVQKNLRISFNKMLEFYGFRWNKEGTEIEVAPDFATRRQVWLKPGDHNFKRITRILSTLRLFGQDEVSSAFFKVLVKINTNDPNKIGASTFGIWKNTQNKSIAT